MEPQVLGDERADEVVAMVVAGVLAIGQTLTGGTARFLELVRKQLLQIGVGHALIDEELVAARSRADHGGRVVLAPTPPVCAEVGRQRLLTPRRLAR